MNASQSVRAGLALCLFALLGAAPGMAQATRTWVSGVGDDVNPCSRTAPCKTFAGAISKTAAHGEISVLDPGGFGAVTITKSITIDGNGVVAGITGSLVNGIIVNAAATDKVAIRNISIIGVNNGLNGIRYLAGGQLTIENVSIIGFQGSPGRAVDVSLAAAGRLVMRNVSISNCEAGVRVNTTAGTAQAVLDNVSIQGVDTHAVEAVTNAVVTVSNSDLSHNFNAGVRAAASSAVVNVEHTTLSFNNAGANSAVAGARIRLSDTAIYNNVSGIVIAAGAFVDSAQDNRVAGNGASAAPTGIITLE